MPWNVMATFLDASFLALLLVQGVVLVYMLAACGIATPVKSFMQTLLGLCLPFSIQW
jgi:hypothetical protein